MPHLLHFQKVSNSGPSEARHLRRGPRIDYAEALKRVDRGQDDRTYQQRKRHYDEAIRASVVQLQADLRAAAMEFGNRAGDESAFLPSRPR
jgi:hypothetical protein